MMLQRINNGKEQTRLDVFPHLNDRRSLKFFLEKIELEFSSNYNFETLTINGDIFKPTKQNSMYNFEINKEEAQDFLLVILATGNEKEVSKRFIECTIYYKRKEKKSLFSLKESLIID